MHKMHRIKILTHAHVYNRVDSFSIHLLTPEKEIAADNIKSGIINC